MKDFDVGERIHEGARSVISRARTQSGQQVVIKRPRSARPGAQARAALQAENAVMQLLDHPAVVRSEGLVQDGLRPVLIMRDAGRSLQVVLREGRLDLVESLSIAKTVAEGLQALHEQGWVHRDVHPGNILIDLQGRATLADLGLATQIERGPAPRRTQWVVGQLRYVAPEQTGRTGGWVDQRSDLYALGTVLFEMLTGTVPFASVDPGELVHAHVARTPPSLRSLDPRVPEAVDRLVAKLLKKRPTERYQSSYGLQADLSRLLHQIDSGEDLSGFELGTEDEVGILRTPQGLYGRESTLEVMQEAALRVADGARVLVRLEGGPGTGKTALVDAFARRPGPWASNLWVGTYSGGRNDEPLHGVVEILRAQLQELLTFDEARLKAKLERITELIGDDGPLLSSWVPELAALLKTQEPAPQIVPEEASERIIRAVLRIVAEMCSEGKPACIILENMHLADAASLRLVQRLLTSPQLHYLLIVLTHVPQAARSGGVLSALVETAEVSEAEHVVLTVEPLNLAETSAWLRDALAMPSEAIGPLAQVLHRQTAGNVLALTRLVPELVEAGHIEFDRAERSWVFDLDTVAQGGLGEDVVQIMLSRMARMPEATQDVLRYAACLGARFDLIVIAEGLGRDRSEVLLALAPAAKAGVVRGADRLLSQLAACGSVCALGDQVEPVWVEFGHERFRDVAYQALDESTRTQAHLRFARWMRKNLSPEAQRERLFEMVAHFEASGNAIEGPEERMAVAALLLEAGERAAAAVAYERAIGLFGAAFELLPEDAWQAHYGLAMKVALTAQQLLLGMRHLKAPASLPTPQALLALATNDADQLTALALVTVHRCRNGEAELALEGAAAALLTHGWDILPKNVDTAVQTLWTQILEALGDRSIMDLVSQPEMKDDLHSSAISLVRATTFAAYMCRRHLVPVVASVAALISVRHGNGPMAGLTYTDLSTALLETSGDVASATALAKVGVLVADRKNSHRAATRVLSTGMTLLYSQDLTEICRQMQELLQFGRETGETLYQGIGGSFLGPYLFLVGTPLDELSRRLGPLTKEVERYMGKVGFRETEMTQRAMQVLRGERSYPWNFREPGEEDKWALTELKNSDGISWGHLLMGRLALIHGDPKAALGHAEGAADWAGLGPIRFRRAEVAFIHAGALLFGDDVEDLDRLQADLGLLSDPALAGAEQCLGHKRRFVEAALAWRRGDHLDALKRFEGAVSAAADVGYVHDRALIAELASRCASQMGLRVVAAALVTEARQGYEAWGAAAEVARLDGVLDAQARSLSGPMPPAQDELSSETDGDRIDLDAVVRASQALAQIHHRAPLIETLLKLLVENAGAQRAALVLQDEGQWKLVARLETDGLIMHEGSLQADALSPVPVGIINYVRRTQTTVVMADARAEGRFGTDPYIARRRPLALVATPVERQGQVVGVLYLENNLMPGAFTAQRLEIVQILAAQAAISMEQARLYDELEQKVEARTRDLAAKNEALQEGLRREQAMQSRMLTVEKMASLGNLVAGVAHELNTPVGALLSSADTLKRGLDRLEATLAEVTDPPRRIGRVLGVLRDNQKVIQEGGTRVGEIVGTLKTFARLDQAERQKADLHEGLETTLKLMGHRLQGIEVIREFGTLVPIDCHPQELNQVFMNLLVNAAQAVGESPDGGQIHVRTGQDDDEVWVEVRDDGPGIEGHVRPNIFDPGFTTRGVGVGLGLGLSICFSIVEDHGGRIEAEGRPGLGARFRVTLPISSGAAHTPVQ